MASNEQSTAEGVEFGGDAPKAVLDEVARCGGLEVDGDRGFAGAPRERLLALSFLSAKTAELPEVTREFLEILVGCWTAAFLPRRLAMVTLALGSLPVPLVA